jgi:antirestriction protein ArdC|tara:strand:- start:512 stop:1405 length:894 start_codon:yes stop_codon:yes gene_type:complete
MTVKVQDVIDTIIEELEVLDESIKQGKPRSEWVMPFKLGSAFPKNYLTDTYYKGFNIFMLYRIARAKGYTAPSWGGWNQWVNNSKKIRFDQRKNGTQILVPIFKKKIADDGTETSKTFFTHKYVFNIEQTEGYDYNADMPKTESVSAEKFHTGLNKLKKEFRLEVKLGTCASYHGNHIVEMPPQDNFVGTSLEKYNEYYSTLCHELIHWTGHSSRLDRKTIRDYSKSTDMRAQEELIAEIGSALMCNHLGYDVDIREDHTKYIHSWCKRLKDKPSSLVSASAQASKAFEFLITEMGL